MIVPSGLVTFLFTDIEGSTKLAQEFPDSLAAALNTHNEILHEAIKSHNGFVFEIVGDAFCAAFEKPEDAVKAAVEVQKAFAAAKWVEVVIKVRIAIHCGKAEWNSPRYMGYMTLARTARVMSSAYGEQVIISNDVYEIFSNNLAADKYNHISFRDLGERRLKDLIKPMRLFQVIGEGLRLEFPPLKTLDSRPNNLPVQLTNFIGREEELRELNICMEQVRMLTIMGSGGTGKTRLAMQIAAEVIDSFENGVWFVELASLQDPRLLAQSVLWALGLHEVPKQNMEDTLMEFVKTKELLIVLDNCEHIVEACAKLSEKLLRASSKLKILATSREALRCNGERIHKTLSLKTPNPDEIVTAEKLSQYESARLFIERALMINPLFRLNDHNAPALSKICCRLDGIPLAIELAAARTGILTLEKINEKLDSKFKFLTSGKRTALPRQQTLKEMIDWSYELLQENEKRLWNRLSVFSNGWTLEEAEEICNDEKIAKDEILDLITNLSDKSVVFFNEKDLRYGMLETIRQYGDEKLRDSSDHEFFSKKHSKFYTGFVETIIPNLEGPDIVSWFKVLDSDRSNIDKALMWSSENEEVNFVRLASAMANYWYIRGNISEGLRWFEIILRKRPEKMYPEYCKIIFQMGRFSVVKSDNETAEKFLNESKEISAQLKDQSGVAASLCALGNIALSKSDFGKASEFYKESLAMNTANNNKSGIALCLNALGNVAHNSGDFPNAHELYQKSLKIYRDIGNKRAIAYSLNNLGSIDIARNAADEAFKQYEESLQIYREIGDKRGISFALNNLGNVAYGRGDFQKAFDLMEQSLQIFRETGDKRGIGTALTNLGNIALDLKDLVKAIKYLEDSLIIQRETADKKGIAEALSNYGSALFEIGSIEKSLETFIECLEISRELNLKHMIISNCHNLGRIEYIKGNYEEARKYFLESIELRIPSGENKFTELNKLQLIQLEVHSDNFPDSAKLLGHLETNTHAGFTENDKLLYEQLILKVKENLTEEDFSKNFANGKLLTGEEAVHIFKVHHE